MRFDPDKQHRRSLRLSGHDYSQSGLYYVTLVAEHRQCLFGRIESGELIASPAGEMIRAWWQEIPDRYPTLALDSFVLMPNHLHGLVEIQHDGGVTLGQAIGWFKSITTHTYLRNVRQGDWRAVEGKVWQRNFYERIVRNDGELQRIRQYIADNPWHWGEDPENPEVVKETDLRR